MLPPAPNRDEFPRGRADTNRVRADPFLAHAFRSLHHGIALVRLPVGEQDNDAASTVLGAGKRVETNAHRVGEVRSLVLDGARGDLPQEQLQRGVVRREWALHEGCPGERNKGNAITGKTGEERGDLLLRSRETIRADILGEHRQRRIEENHDVDSGGLYKLSDRTPLRTRGRENCP